MTTIIIAAIFVIAVIGIALFIKGKKKVPSLGQVNRSFQANTQQPCPDQEFEDILDSLLSLNILLRKDGNLARNMIENIEAIIDDLMVVVPRMMEQYPNETLTYEIKKIGKEHLYKTVKEYLDLSPDSRENQFEIFKKTINNLHEVSNRSRNIVEKNETAEFKTMANFLAGKFS
jgi:hypothetical protein